MTSLFENSDLSVLDVENLRLHYAKTLKGWLDLYEENMDEVRRMFEALEVPVSRLLRARFGPIDLADMRRGTQRVLELQELKSLYAEVALSPDQC